MDEVTKTAGILFFREDEVLLVYHKEKAKHQTGVYGIPAGRLEPGENEIEAAIRETEQETTLNVGMENLIPLPIIYAAKIQRKKELPRIFSLKVFLCKKFKGEPNETEENSPKWIKISELHKYNLLPNVEKIINDGLLILKQEK
jgi:8-oxo-dGTP diphosphatase